MNDEIKELLRAVIDGKQMQEWGICSKKWKDCSMEDAVFQIYKMLAGDIEWKVRIKPEPIECWVTFYPERNAYGKFGAAYNTKEMAEINASIGGCIIHMREVIE